MKVRLRIGLRAILPVVLLLILLPLSVRADSRYSLLGFPHGGIAPGGLILTRLSWAASDWRKYDTGPFALLRLKLLSINDSDRPKREKIGLWAEISHINITGRYMHWGDMDSRVTSAAISADLDRLRFNLSDNSSLQISPGLAICRIDADYRGGGGIDIEFLIPTVEARGGELFWGFPIFVDISLIRVLSEKTPTTRLRVPLRFGTQGLFQIVRSKERNRPGIQERNFPFPYTGLTLAGVLEFLW